MKRQKHVLWTASAPLLAMASLIVACSDGAPRMPGSGGRGEAASEVTAISIGLPSRDGLKTQVADIETRMNGYRLTIKPVDASCAGATSVDEVGNYETTARLTASLQQGCDYDVTLALGNKEAGSGSGSGANQPDAGASVTSYNGEVKAIISRACVSCHASGSSYGDLSTYSSAKTRGSSTVNRAVIRGDMPPSGSLSSAEKATLQAWADGGYLESSPSNPSNPSNPANPSRGDLSATYYKNNTAKRISKTDIEGKSEYRAAMALQLQADGRAIGLQENSSTNPNPSNPNPTIPGNGSSGGATLTAARNLSLTDASGSSQKLSDVFKGKYLLVDFSQSTCGYCISAAQRLNSSAAEQKQFDGSKCSHVTLVPRSDLSAWRRTIGGDTFAGKHSYGMPVGFYEVASTFGISFRGTPTFMLIDSEGKVIASEAGGMPAEVDQLCQ